MRISRTLLFISALLLSAPAVLAQGVDSPALKVTLLGTGNPRPVIARFGRNGFTRQRCPSRKLQPCS
jgi:hypothetical protein